MVNEEVQGSHHHHGQHQHGDVLCADEERAEFDGVGNEKGRKGIGALGQDVNGDLFGLHPITKLDTMDGVRIPAYRTEHRRSTNA